MIVSSRLRFLGEQGLKALRDCSASVIGAGGGGSHVVQQLAHLGLRRVFVIDHDRLERSNVNRVVGASYEDVGTEKARLLAKRFKGLGGDVVPVVGRAEHEEGRDAIATSDIVVSCVDTYRSRLNIERICRSGLTPLIDVGLTISLDDSGIVGAIGGQIVASLPGGPCLQCTQVVTPARLEADREEYVAGAPAQQVISMNGILASQAVNTLIALITEYAGTFKPPTYLVYDGLRHELRRHPWLPESELCPHYDVQDAGYRYPVVRGSGQFERSI